VQVAHHFQEVAILLTEDRPEPPLKAVPDPAVAAVQVLRKGPLDLLHESAHGYRARFEQEVNMIGHEAIGVAPDVVPAQARPQSGEVFSIVRPVPEEHLPVIAPGDDVVQPLRDVEARCACLPEGYPEVARDINRSKGLPDPNPRKGNRGWSVELRPSPFEETTDPTDSVGSIGCCRE
jgi:hypothetical protein